MIYWDSYAQHQWLDYIARVQRINLLQSEDYLYAMTCLNQQCISRGLIMFDEKEAGIVNVLEAGILRNAVHGVILDRGPLWFDGYGTSDHFEKFVEAFSQKHTKRFGRRIRFIPEYEDTQRARQILEAHNYKAASTHSYETIWLDLRSSTEILRKNLNPKWRNKLNQSDRKPLDLVWKAADTKSIYFKWLMGQYVRDRALRKYNGPSLKMMNALGESFSRGKNMMIGCALLDKQPIAGILLFIHSSSATYQIGYISDVGRENRAHYALLWDALGKLKERGIHDFDLGGVNEEGAKGVKTFKKGMGGTIEKTLGLYS
ncbi:MAG: GNAT family N-acetyltransferase [Alphaproteobacteria bacterium]|nr:GNAT family N-acetyltransferase [Alphaproteobacteria bacterium]